jgi:hypothetical protein
MDALRGSARHQARPARARAEPMNSVLMSSPIPVRVMIACLRASISPAPQVKSSRTVPAAGLTTRLQGR